MNYSNQAFADFFKNSVDMNQIFSTQRRNAEAWSEAGQVIVEGAQAATRVGSEAIRSNVENLLKTSKDLFGGGSPEVNLAKQADFAKSLFETTVSNLREMTEMATKCGFEAFEVLNQRAAESMSEFSKTAASATQQAKKKSS